MSLLPPIHQGTNRNLSSKSVCVRVCFLKKNCAYSSIMITLKMQDNWHGKRLKRWQFQKSKQEVIIRTRKEWKKKKTPCSGNNSEEVRQDIVTTRMGEMREEKKSKIMLVGSKNSIQWHSRSEYLLTIKAVFHRANKRRNQLHFCTTSLSVNLSHSILLITMLLIISYYIWIFKTHDSNLQLYRVKSVEFY